MKSIVKNFALSAILSLTFLSACGKNDDDKKNNGQGPAPISLTPFEQLTGEWSGIYRSLSDGKPMGDAISCKVSLKADGSFIISLEDGSQAAVEGEWTEFQGKTLLLKVSGSTMTRIATSGKVVEPSYDLLGSSLRIGSSDYELKLSKKTTPNNSNPGGGDSSVYSGNWNCHDGAGRKTTVFIYDGKDFKLSSMRQGERAFISQGGVTSSSGDAVKLSPTSSSDPLAEGSSFELRKSGLVYELLLHRPTTSSIKLGLCSK